MFLQIERVPLPGQRESWMRAPHLTGGSINTLQTETTTKQDLFVTHRLMLLAYRFSCSASAHYHLANQRSKLLIIIITGVFFIDILTDLCGSAS